MLYHCIKEYMYMYVPAYFGKASMASGVESSWRDPEAGTQS